MLSDGEVVPHVMKYSMEDDKWRESVPMPLALYGHGSTSYEGNIFVTGGKTTDKVCNVPVWGRCIGPITRQTHRPICIADRPRYSHLHKIGIRSSPIMLDNQYRLHIGGYT